MSHIQPCITLAKRPSKISETQFVLLCWFPACRPSVTHLPLIMFNSYSFCLVCLKSTYSQYGQCYKSILIFEWINKMCISQIWYKFCHIDIQLCIDYCRLYLKNCIIHGSIYFSQPYDKTTWYRNLFLLTFSKIFFMPP